MVLNINTYTPYQTGLLDLGSDRKPNSQTNQSSPFNADLWTRITSAGDRFVKGDGLVIVGSVVAATLFSSAALTLLPASLAGIIAVTRGVHVLSAAAGGVAGGEVILSLLHYIYPSLFESTYQRYLSKKDEQLNEVSELALAYLNQWLYSAAMSFVLGSAAGVYANQAKIWAQSLNPLIALVGRSSQGIARLFNPTKAKLTSQVGHETGQETTEHWSEVLGGEKASWVASIVTGGGGRGRSRQGKVDREQGQKTGSRKLDFRGGPLVVAVNGNSSGRDVEVTRHKKRDVLLVDERSKVWDFYVREHHRLDSQWIDPESFDPRMDNALGAASNVDPDPKWKILPAPFRMKLAAQGTSLENHAQYPEVMAYLFGLEDPDFALEWALGLADQELTPRIVNQILPRLSPDQNKKAGRFPKAGSHGKSRAKSSRKLVEFYTKLDAKAQEGVVKFILAHAQDQRKEKRINEAEQLLQLPPDSPGLATLKAELKVIRQRYLTFSPPAPISKKLTRVGERGLGIITILADKCKRDVSWVKSVVVDGLIMGLWQGDDLFAARTCAQALGIVAINSGDPKLASRALFALKEAHQHPYHDVAEESFAASYVVRLLETNWSNPLEAVPALALAQEIYHDRPRMEHLASSLIAALNHPDKEIQALGTIGGLSSLVKEALTVFLLAEFELSPLPDKKTSLFLLGKKVAERLTIETCEEVKRVALSIAPKIWPHVMYEMAILFFQKWADQDVVSLVDLVRLSQRHREAFKNHVDFLDPSMVVGSERRLKGTPRGTLLFLLGFFYEPEWETRHDEITAALDEMLIPYQLRWDPFFHTVILAVEEVLVSPGSDQSPYDDKVGLDRTLKKAGLVVTGYLNHEPVEKAGEERAEQLNRMDTAMHSMLADFIGKVREDHKNFFGDISGYEAFCGEQSVDQEYASFLFSEDIRGAIETYMDADAERADVEKATQALRTRFIFVPRRDLADPLKPRQEILVRAHGLYTQMNPRKPSGQDWPTFSVILNLKEEVIPPLPEEPPKGGGKKRSKEDKHHPIQPGQATYFDGGSEAPFKPVALDDPIVDDVIDPDHERWTMAPSNRPPTALPPDLIRPRIESGKSLISFADVGRLGTKRYGFKPVSIEINGRNYFIIHFEDWLSSLATCFGIHRDVKGHFHGISFGFDKIGEENYAISVKDELLTAGQIEVEGQNIYWLLTENRQRVLARNSKGKEVPYIKRVEERAKLKKAVVDSGNTDWQEIYRFFEFSDLVPLETLQQGYEFMSRVARSNFPYEVGVGISPINGHFVPCLELGNAHTTNSGNLGLTDVLLHNHSWTAKTSKVPSLGKALYRLSGMDLLCFEKEIEYVGKLIGVNSVFQTYDPYVTSVLSNHGAIQLRYRPNPAGQAELHVLYTDTRNVSLHPSPKELIDIIWGEMNWTMEYLYPAKLTAEQVTSQEFSDRTGIDVRFTGSLEAVPEPSTIDPTDLADKNMWLVAYESVFGPKK